MTPEELHDMQNRLTVISSHPNVSAEDSRYAMACALRLIGEVRRLREDGSRLDFLQSVKSSEFTALNSNLEISAIQLFTIRSQHVRGDSIREVIDKAIAAYNPQ